MRSNMSRSNQMRSVEYLLLSLSQTKPKRRGEKTKQKKKNQRNEPTEIDPEAIKENQAERKKEKKKV